MKVGLCRFNMQTPPSSFECVPLRGMVAEDGISNHNFPEQSPLSDVPDTEAVRVATSRWSDGTFLVL